MKKLVSCICFVLVQYMAFSQTIEGDKLLELVGKPVSDQMFQNLKKQETFYTDAWDEDFTIYITRESNIITQVELENGKLRYGSKDQRYGNYARTLPMGLSWSMSVSDFSTKLGKPVLTSTSMNFSDYEKNGWKVTVYFEQGKPVSVNFKKSVAPYIPPAQNDNPTGTSNAAAKSPGWLINLKSSDKAEMSWPAFREIVTNFNNLGSYAGKDSVDYIGEVYYSSLMQMPGFERTALKRKKRTGGWYFEAFIKIAVDSNKARNTFFALYDAIKETVNANAKDDFILAAVAKDPVSKSPVNWMAQWSLYTNYKLFPAGLGKLRFILMLSGMKNAFKNDQMEYTLKIYLCDPSVEVDFFTWDKPR